MELPIETQKGEYAYLHLTYPFAVIYTEPKIIPWLYENFINIYLSPTNDLMYAGYEFEFTPKCLFDFCEFHKDTWDSKTTDFITYAIRALGESNYYLYIWLNEYYLPGQSAYQRYNYRHVFMLYGYDKRDRVFLAYGMDRNLRFSKLKFTFEDIYSAFLSGNELAKKDDVVLTLFRLKPMDYEYSFSINRFNKQLLNYVLGTDCASECFWEVGPHHCYSAKLPYGRNAYAAWIEFFKRKEEMNYLDFRSIHLLFEQKKGICERLCYISETMQDYISNSAGLANSINEYQKSVVTYSLCRLLYLKNRTENGIVGAAVKERIVSLVTDAYKKEGDILTSIINELQMIQEPVGFPNALNRQDVKKELKFSYKDGKYGLKVEYIFSSPICVEELAISRRKHVKILLDNMKMLDCKAFEETNRTLFRKTFQALLCRKITAYIVSEFPIKSSEIKICARMVDCARNCHATASSTWETSDEVSFNNVAPWNAVDGNEDTFWNSSANWHSGEWIKVTLPQRIFIRKVLIKERKRVKRIREYGVEVENEQGEWTEVLHYCGTLNDRAKIHEIPPSFSKSIRLVIYATQKDLAGFDEPAIARFEIFD